MSDTFLDPIKRTRVSEQVAEKLETRIREGTLQLGEQLPSERKLMEMLGVGRGAIREALRILEMKGYVEIRQGVGAFVCGIEGGFTLPLASWLSDKKELLLNFFEIRQMIEPQAAAIAARRATPEQLLELQTAHHQFATHVETGELSKAILADAAFHHLLAVATGNTLLVVTMDTLRRSVLIGWKAPLRVPGRMVKTIEEHRLILVALEQRNEAMAAEAARRHLDNAIAELSELGLTAKE